ncbi:MAG: hypothetical protein QHH07_09080 [Sedimentisphaerales bacterium]|jgi:NADH:ubiquinone oxidoreductase subunit 5 (subunit L)/multisubunit Na+/H+ antiporter MnhA subunit|nr:hypothetical protein [Sedimentisphaerales bacterium]
MVAVAVCTLIMYLRLHRYVFLGAMPAAVSSVDETHGTMRVVLIGLTVITLGMGLLLVLPQLRSAVLEPAVDVLTGGVSQYLARLARLGLLEG